jgi:hypothetical protein
MTRTYSYRLPSNAEVYMEETGDDHRTSAGAEKEGLRTRQGETVPFSEVIAPMGEVAQVVFDAVKSKVSTPDEITLEFGANLKGGVNLFLVSGKTDATFKVTLSWKGG